MNNCTKALILALLCLFTTNLFSQADQGDESLIPKVLPPSPNAASLGKYGQIPVGMYTGTAQVEIPLHTLSTSKLSVPISLNYSSNGIKVDEIASNVGLGWSFNAGGVITRSLYDEPDANNFLSPTGPLAHDQPTLDFLWAATSENSFDTQPDIFSFNFNGYSGKFYINHQGVPVQVSPSPLRIETNPGFFTITTPDGAVYYFGGGNATESTRNITTQCGGYGHGGQSAIYVETAWYLTKIEHPAGDEILFSYDRKHYTYAAGTSQGASRIIQPFDNGCSSTSQAVCVNIVTGKMAYLTEIQTQGHGKATFAYSKRVAGGGDLYKLDEVKIYGAEDQLTRQFELEYDLIVCDVSFANSDVYVGSSEVSENNYNKRLFLSELIEKGNDGSLKPAHRFSYDSPESLPPRLSYAQDYWGFFNGESGNNTSLPNTLVNHDENLDMFHSAIASFTSGGQGANKAPNGNFAKLGLLKEIVYPTGGRTELNYEPHTYYGPMTSTPSPAVPVNMAVSTDYSSTSDIHIETIQGSSTAQFVQFTATVGTTEGVAACWDANGEPTNPPHHTKALFQVKNLSTGENVSIYKETTQGWTWVGPSLWVTEASENVNYRFSMAKDVQFEVKLDVSKSCLTADVAFSYFPDSEQINGNVEAGGMRIASLVNFDGKGNSTTKNYDYAALNCLDCSSGILNRESIAPALTFSQAVGSSGGTYDMNGCWTLHLSSSTLFPLYSSQGNHIQYFSVIESMGEQLDNGATVYEYNIVGDDLPSVVFGLRIPGTPFTNKFGGGREKSRKVYKKEGANLVLLNSTENTYFHDTRLDNMIEGYTARKRVSISNSAVSVEDKVMHHDLCKYQINSQWHYLSSSVQTQYDEQGQNPIAATTNYYYENEDHLQLTRTETTNSDGTMHISRLKYAPEYENGNMAPNHYIRQLNNQNIIVPIETSSWIKKSGEAEKLIRANLTTYKDFGNNQVLPHETWRLETSSPLSNFSWGVATATGLNKDSRYVLAGSVSTYGTKANIQEFQKTNDTPISFLWGYDKNLPVAKVANAALQDVAYLGFEYPEEADSPWWQTANTINYLPHAGAGAKKLLAGENMGCTIIPSEAGQHKSFKYTAWVKHGQGIMRLRLSNATADNTYYPAASVKVDVPFNVVWNNAGQAYTLVEATIDLAAIRAQYAVPDHITLRLHANIINGTVETKLDELRLHPSDALMTTVTYDSNSYLMTSMSNEKNVLGSFEYDSFYRFKEAYDQDHNLISYNDYHYKGTSGVENYVRGINVLAAGKSSADINSLTVEEKQDVYQYFDGLGRPIQTVAHKQSPQQKNIIQVMEYDELGRQTKQYLPYTIASANANYRSNAFYEQANFYTNGLLHAATSKPFAEAGLEASPLSRLKEQGAVGEDWQKGNGHSISMNYGSNATNEVIDFATGTNFAANQLTKETSINENGHTSVAFKDKLGRVIQTQKLIDGAWAKTAYVYDEFNNIKCVLPPLGVEAYEAGLVLGTVVLEQLPQVYQYKYDKRQRLVEKKIPGTDWIYYVYDNLDRVVLTQDGNNRNDDVWQFSKFDILGRPIMTGISNLSGSRAAIQYQVNAFYTLNDVPNYEQMATGNHGYTNRTTPIIQNDGILSVTYYDNYDFDRDGSNDFPFISDAEFSGNAPFDRLAGQLTGSKTRVLDSNKWLYTVSYYDERGRVIQIQADNHLDGRDITHTSYDFIGKTLATKRTHEIPNKDAINIRQRFDYDHAGRVLNAYHKIDGDDEIRLSSSQYNELEQLIEKNLHATSFNISNTNYLQSVDYTYNIRGWLERINDILVSSYSEGAEISLRESGTVALKFSLIEANSAKQGAKGTKGGTAKKGGEVSTFPITVEIDLFDLSTEESSLSQSLATISTRTENALVDAGVTKESFRVAMTLEVQRVFKNDWLLLRANDDNDDLFAMRLNYTEANTDLNASAQFNGNISSAYWQVKGQGVKAYGYQYDELDRLLNADYAKITSGVAGWEYGELNRYGVSQISYDLNGNILGLARKGMNGVSNGQAVFGEIDFLSYVYSGNQLKAVSDQTNNDHGFKDGAQLSIEYSYDANGNMVTDENKGIAITYNHLNLPTEVRFSTTRWLEWDYDAAGIKLQKRVYDNNQLTSTKDYLGGIEYTDGDLEAVYHAEGRLIPKAQNGPILGTSAQYGYEYTLKDHLGNSRVMFGDLDQNGSVDASEILQVEDYYPFGLGHEGLQNPQVGLENAYQYNGKELNSDFGLGWNDYGARWYMADIGRWGAVDPLAEKYVAWSEYNYVMGNPLKFIDPDGKRIAIYGSDEYQEKVYDHLLSLASKSEKGAQLFLGAILSKKTFVIADGKGEENSITKGNGYEVLSFNLEDAKTKSDKKNGNNGREIDRSPEVVLAHELAHFSNSIEHKLLDGNDGRQIDLSAEEVYAVEMENIVRKEMFMEERTHYNGHNVYGKGLKESSKYSGHYFAVNKKGYATESFKSTNRLKFMYFAFTRLGKRRIGRGTYYRQGAYLSKATKPPISEYETSLYERH